MQKRFRMRRGRLVEIPEKWLNKTVFRQTIQKRRSKRIHKHRGRNLTRQSGYALEKYFRFKKTGI